MTIAEAVLQHPRLYVAAQRAVGAHLARRQSIKALELQPGERLLDIGCGPAYYFDELPPCAYHGFDTDKRYIDWARSQYGDRGTFHDVPYAEEHRDQLAPFDAVMLMGLLHHLDDEQAHALLDLIARSLEPDGRVVALDTVLFVGQSRLSRVLAVNDRGDFVRRPEGFLALAREHFTTVDHRVVGDTARMPSAHFLMVLRGPKVSAA